MEWPGGEDYNNTFQLSFGIFHSTLLALDLLFQRTPAEAALQLAKNESEMPVEGPVDFQNMVSRTRAMSASNFSYATYPDKHR